MRIIDPLSVPKVVLELQRRSHPIEQLVFRNPIQFFGQSDKWTFQA